MIVQEINLYQDQFKDKTLWLSASQQLWATGLFVIFLVFSSYWYHSQRQQVQDQNTAYQQQKKRATVQLENQRETLKALLANNKIDGHIAKVSADIAVRKKIINFVSLNQFGSGQDFSSQLSGLTDINISNVWLNEISLAEDYLKLSGSTLNAELIPEYFNQFSQRQLFNGRVFEVFQLNREQEQSWKVDFLIASRVVIDE